MDTRKLEIFCEVYRLKGYSLAAKRLGLTQSAVSQQVRALEKELGAVLLEGVKRAQPTRAGEFVFKEGALILAHLEDIRSGVKGELGISGGKVRCGMIDTVAVDLMPRVLKRFKNKFPDVRIETVVRASGELIDMVLGNELDCAVVVTNMIPDELNKKNIYKDSIVAVVPANSKIRKAEIGIRALRGEPLILYPKGSHTRMIVDEAFSAAGIVPAISMETHYPAAIMSLVREGMGLGLVSELTARGERLEGERIVHIRELKQVRTIGVVTHARRRLPLQVKAFMAYLRG